MLVHNKPKSSSVLRELCGGLWLFSSETSALKPTATDRTLYRADPLPGQVERPESVSPYTQAPRARSTMRAGVLDISAGTGAAGYF